MMETELRHCARMMCRERGLARAAPSPEVAQVHLQLIMLYKAQYRVLKRRLRLRP
jgi:hypothetical protein